MSIPTASLDFMHLVFIDDLGGYKSGALTFSGGNALKAHGSSVAISDLNDPDPIWGLNPQTVDQHMMTTVAHEITHGLYNKTTGLFNAEEHTTDPNENGNPLPFDAEDEACLMFENPTPANAELATVRFFPLVQRELRVRTNEGLVVTVQPMHNLGASKPCR